MAASSPTAGRIWYLVPSDPASPLAALALSDAATYNVGRNPEIAQLVLDSQQFPMLASRHHATLAPISRSTMVAISSSVSLSASASVSSASSSSADPSPFAYRVTDEKAANGLFVNGRRVAAADLREGDTVIFGHPASKKYPLEPAGEGASSSASSSAQSKAIPEADWKRSPFCFRVESRPAPPQKSKAQSKLPHKSAMHHDQPESRARVAMPPPPPPHALASLPQVQVPLVIDLPALSSPLSLLETEEPVVPANTHAAIHANSRKRAHNSVDQSDDPPGSPSANIKLQRSDGSSAASSAAAAASSSNGSDRHSKEDDAARIEMAKQLQDKEMELSAAAARHRALEERIAQFEAQAKESAAASSASSSSSSSSSSAAAASSLSSPSASVSQILAEEWFCCICRELMANAVMLTCGHCFCEQCVDSLQQANAAVPFGAAHAVAAVAITCPSCRCVSRTPPVASAPLRNTCNALAAQTLAPDELAERQRNMDAWASVKLARALEREERAAAVQQQQQQHRPQHPQTHAQIVQQLALQRQQQWQQQMQQQLQQQRSRNAPYTSSAEASRSHWHAMYGGGRDDDDDDDDDEDDEEQDEDDDDDDEERDDDLCADEDDDEDDDNDDDDDDDEEDEVDPPSAFYSASDRFDFSIEAASTGRSKCVRCGRAIAARELRTVRWRSNDAGQQTVNGFYHVACFRATFAARARLAVTDLPGFEQLSAAERRTLNAQWQ